MQKLRRGQVKQWIMAFLCMIVLVCTAITLTVLFRPLYYFDIDHLEIPERSGYSKEVCKRNYDVLIDYNLLVSPDRLEFPDLAMSEQGRIHFEEVKRIFVGAQVITIVGLIWILGRILWQRRKKDLDYRWLKWTSPVCLILVTVVGAGVAINWEQAFVIMHKIFFRNDYWIFDADTDPVIRILPDTFFMHCGIMIISLVLVFLLVCRFLYCKLGKEK